MTRIELADDERSRLTAHTQILAELARKEDLGPGDITASLMADPGEGDFHLVARQPCVIAGCAIAETVLDAYGGGLRITWCDGVTDGMRIDHPPRNLAILDGPVTTMLSAERVLLNFLQRLSGVATLTRAYVDAVAGTSARIMDTRKTTPGWRLLEKYAVRCGGGVNHRTGLYDAILIKDNHLAAAPKDRFAATVFDMLNRIPQGGDENGAPPPAFVEVEVDTPDQFKQVIDVVGVDVILLDNFSVDQLKQAVAIRASRGLADRIKLEASGGVNLQTVAAIAATGVDRISVGAITHSATAIDLALDRAEN